MAAKTSDPQDELFDLVDENDEVIGRVTRGEANRNPKLIHRAAAILVFNKKGQLFLQKRSKTKDTYPGFWTISASGHVVSGQTYRRTAIRELKEELGITDPVYLKRMGKVILRMLNETEFQTIYKTTYDGPIKLNKQEIEEGRFFNLDSNFSKTIVKKIRMTPMLKNVIKNFLLALLR